MSGIAVIFKRELSGYFETPVAYVFIAIFLMLAGIFTFYLFGFFESGQAELSAFFQGLPWLYLFLLPAIAMRLWSEERRHGTIELLMTLPIHTYEVVLGKFFASWAFALIALFLTFPMWITVNYLGEPDNGAILAGYLAAVFVSGGFLSIGSCISAMTQNQVVAFVIAAMVCFLFILSGSAIVLDFFVSLGFTQKLVDLIGSFSFLAHFDEMIKGVIGLHNVVFFGSLMALFLFLNIVVVDSKRL